ncbi:hypothetical protein [Shimia sp.]
MQTLNTEPFTFTFMDFLSLHSGGLLLAVLIGAAGAWVFAEMEG